LNLEEIDPFEIESWYEFALLCKKENSTLIFKEKISKYIYITNLWKLNELLAYTNKLHGEEIAQKLLEELNK